MKKMKKPAAWRCHVCGKLGHDRRNCPDKGKREPILAGGNNTWTKTRLEMLGATGSAKELAAKRSAINKRARAKGRAKPSKLEVIEANGKGTVWTRDDGRTLYMPWSADELWVRLCREVYEAQLDTSK